MSAVTAKADNPGSEPLSHPHRAGAVRTRSERAAPKAITGCVSALSTCTQSSPDYRAALKHYGEVYSDYQAYLTPADPLAGHAYGSVPACSEDSVNWLLAGPGAPSEVSDDEVERCGYFGWLHH